MLVNNFTTEYVIRGLIPQVYPLLFIYLFGNGGKLTWTN